MLRVFAMLVFATVLVGCAKPTEEQRLAKFRGSLKYKTYRLASDRATSLAVAEYNKTTSETVDELLVHSTLGVTWFLLNQGPYCLVEADLIAESPSADAAAISLCLKSIALYKMDCPELSRAHYGELKQLLAAERGTDANQIEVDHKLLLVSLVAVGLCHGDPELAKFAADALGAISQLDYLPPLVGAIAEAQQGSPLQAAKQLRELNRSERFSAHKQAIVGEIAEIIASAPEGEKLGEEIANRVVVRLVRGVLDDLFTAENQQVLWQRVKAMPKLITGQAEAEGETEAEAEATDESAARAEAEAAPN